VLDYFADTARLKDFQEIDHTNLPKIYGYGTYWYARRKPLQIVAKNVDDAMLCINERVAINMVIPKLFNKLGIDPTDDLKNPAEFKDFFELFLYNLVYRIYTPQSLEFMFQAFCTGYSAH
jgi:hypothetical protein